MKEELIDKKMSNLFYKADYFRFFKRQYKIDDINNGLISYISIKGSSPQCPHPTSKKPITKTTKDPNSQYFPSTTQSYKMIELTHKKAVPSYMKQIERKSKTIETDFEKKSKKFCPFLIYQKSTLEKVRKIRDLFVQFDTNKNKVFDKNELLSMFHCNNIPITVNELSSLFSFSKRKQSLSFLDFIRLQNFNAQN